MSGDLVLDYLTSQIDEKLDALKDALYDNRIDNIEEYRFVAGQVRGLKSVRQLIVDTRDKLDSL